MLELSGRPAGNGVLCDWAARQALEDMKAEDGLLDACELRLYTEGPTPNTSQTWADFTEATFTGYAPKTALTFEAASWEDGYSSVVSLDPPPVFTCTAAGENLVKGWALTKQVDAATKIIYAEDFDAVKAMTSPGHQIICPATINLGCQS